MSTKFKALSSASLYNHTLAPGWSREEAEALRRCLMKFGFGAWSKIQNCGALPGKTASQLNLQTQRMVGQQSLGGLVSVHCDPRLIWEENKQKDGKRKGGILVNEGNNPSKEEFRRQQEEHRNKYGLSQEEIDSIEIPKPVEKALENSENADFEFKEKKLEYLKTQREKIAQKLAQIRQNQSSPSKKKSKVEEIFDIIVGDEE